MWEITFYGFSSSDVEAKETEIKEASKEASIEIEEIYAKDGFNKFIDKKTGEIT